MSEVSKVGKRGTVVIPARLRRQYGIEEGDLVIAEGHPEGVLIRPAVSLVRQPFFHAHAVWPRDEPCFNRLSAGIENVR